MNERSKLIAETGVSLDQLFDRISSRLHSIYFMDCEHNTIIPVKTNYLADSYSTETSLNWDTEIQNIIERFMATPYRGAAQVLYSRSYIQKKYGSPDSHSEYIFQTNEDEWRKLNVVPVKIQDNQCMSAVITIEDITEVKKRSELMEKQLSAVKHNVEDMKNLCVLFTKNYLMQLVKYDTVTGLSSLIRYDDNEITEVPVQDFMKSYETLIDTIHPDDKERMKSFISLDKIRTLKPKENHTVIYRSKIKDGIRFRWYKTSILVLEEENTTAFISSQDITSEIESNLEVFKNA